MNQYVRLTRPYPEKLALVNRLLAEGEKGGATLLIYREGLLIDGEPDDMNSEAIDLEERFLWLACDEFYADGINYRPSVRFRLEGRAQAFKDWLAEQP